MWSADAYAAALRFAAERHQGQRVPGTELPYVIHVAAVCAEIMGALARERFDQPDLAVQCALLHDTIEDTATSRAEIAERFGEAVAAGVAALTKDDQLAKAVRMADSLRRIRDQPREVWAVKLADRITNLDVPPPHWDGARRVGYRAEAGDILAALGESSPYLANRLRERIDRYAAHLVP